MKQTNRKADLPLLLLAVVLIFLIVCPVGMIFAKAVMQNGRLDFSPAVQTLLNPENAHMIGNSLLLGVLVVLLSTLIAAPLAYLFSRTKFARYRVFDILFMIPFMTPPYIASMGWILFMQKKGLSQQSDFFLADESDLCDNVGDNYDVVIADKTLRRVMKNFSGEFIDFPHFGLSGRLLQGESEKI